MGPTASGKTDLAMALCDALPCDIISVDSALVYRGLDIGSAKPGQPHRAPKPPTNVRNVRVECASIGSRRDSGNVKLSVCTTD